MERFPDELILRKLNGPEWEVREPFRYWSTRLQAWITVPVGFITDLASVPWFARWYVSVDGEHTKAALVHDWLYVRASQTAFPNLTRTDADKIFLEAMTVRGIPKWKRKPMYWGVWLGGGRTFRDD